MKYNTTIEQQCNQKITWYGRRFCRVKRIPIEEWNWEQKPYSKKYPHANKKKVLHVLYRKIDEFIKKADSTECLTSNCTYIRQCKQWFMERSKHKK